MPPHGLSGGDVADSPVDPLRIVEVDEGMRFFVGDREGPEVNYTQELEL